MSKIEKAQFLPSSRSNKEGSYVVQTSTPPSQSIKPILKCNKWHIKDIAWYVFFAFVFGLFLGVYFTWGTTHVEYRDVVTTVQNASIDCGCSTFSGNQRVSPELCRSTGGKVWECEQHD